MIAETERRKVCQDQQGWTVADRIVATDHLLPKQARALTRVADRLDRFPLVSAAVGSGDATVDQATAICVSLKELPAVTDADVVEGLQWELIFLAERFGAEALRRLGNHLVEILEPDTVEDRLRAQLEAEERRRRRDRYLSYRHSENGAGRLPRPTARRAG